MAAPPDDELLTVAEIAATLKLNQQTIRNWIDAGKLPRVRIGRRVRVYRSDLNQLITDAATIQDDRADTPVRSIWDGWIPDPQLPPRSPGPRRTRRDPRATRDTPVSRQHAARAGRPGTVRS